MVMYIRARGIEFAQLSAIFLLDVWIVLMVCHFYFVLHIALNDLIG